jgi:hypothetical protein
VLLLALGLLLWRRGFRRLFPAFVAFAILSALGELTTFLADIIPSVTALTFWRVVWTSLLVESLLKFLVIGEVFSRVFAPYPSIGRPGKILVSAFGAALVLLSGMVAAFARGDSAVRLISGAHLLEQTVFLIESGLILLLFLFAAYFRLSWDRLSFGILLGLGISACEHLAAWAVVANAAPSSRGRTFIDFANMATNHICVLIWCYYLLIPQKPSGKPPAEPPKNDLDVWNRELERLLQQ